MGLLFNIFATQSVSQNYDAMHQLIMDELGSMSGSVSITVDKASNILVTKGKPPEGMYYPTYACHTDTVHDFRDGYSIIRSPKHVWMAYYPGPDGKPIQTGIGGDDKCGIYMCLRLLRTLPYVKCAFFTDEEMGCVGSLKCDISFFDDSRWVIQGDRKHNGDIIAEGLGKPLCSTEFIRDLSAVGSKFGYSVAPGVWTDVTKLKVNRGLAVSAVNISVGYWNPHSPTEIVVEADLNRAIHFAEAAAARMTTRYEHKIPTYPTFNSGVVQPVPKTCKSIGCIRLVAAGSPFCLECNMQMKVTGKFKCVDCGIGVYTYHEEARRRCTRCDALPLH